MDEKGLKEVFTVYRIRPSRLLASQKGYRNTSFPAVLSDGRRVNFILYKNEPGIYERIKRINDVSSFLSRRGLPVRRPLEKRILELATPSALRYGALYDYLSGDTIPWEGYTRNHIKLAGKAMGEMHTHLREFGPLRNDVAAEYLQIVKRMQVYFNDADATRALREKLDITIPKTIFPKFIKLLEYCTTLPHQQVLHMDFVRGNLLFRHSQPNDMFTLGDISLSGILDFEKTAYGTPIIDVARTLAFLLVDCKYKSPEKIRKYFLHSGYNKRSSAVSIALDSKLLDELIVLFLIHDFYKFLRHNPYEFLPQNEHFIRTRDMLCTLGVIRYTKDR